MARSIKIMTLTEGRLLFHHSIITRSSLKLRYGCLEVMYTATVHIHESFHILQYWTLKHYKIAKQLCDLEQALLEHEFMPQRTKEVHSLTGGT